MNTTFVSLVVILILVAVPAGLAEVVSLVASKVAARN
jgi:hypothetical protein